ncbi:MAG: GIY-YIG nuclease family protein [Saprospirales bacterium]|nr:GIY-YIG nuclease family protein [Saprospirales bacterium]MBK8491070.1 GIY-YIG nuclease family protein [Saprospirales bacterium]
MFHTYIIQSQTSGSFYIGQTNNLDERLRRHNGNRNKATKGKGPWKLVYSKAFGIRSEAVILERRLKSFKNKDFLKKWVEENGGIV